MRLVRNLKKKKTVYFVSFLSDCWKNRIRRNGSAIYSLHRRLHFYKGVLIIKQNKFYFWGSKSVVLIFNHLSFHPLDYSQKRIKKELCTSKKKPYRPRKKCSYQFYVSPWITFTFTLLSFYPCKCGLETYNLRVFNHLLGEMNPISETVARNQNILP